ncbi:putative glycine dehydrogenase (decarboxylating) subunit 1 [subsurface metagenome]
MPYIPNTDEDRKEMFKRIGVSSFEELMSEIPEELRLKGEYNLQKALSEYEAKHELESIAGKNRTTKECISFLGAGIYDHFIPSVVNIIANRPEFYTAYTPYQAEVSQGTLQAIFEFQSMICELFDMDVANASMYDGATALAESVHMVVNINQRKEIVLFDTVHPHYQKTVETYTKGHGIEIKKVPYSTKGMVEPSELEKIIDENTSACLVQHPNFLGILEEMEEIERIVHKNGALLVSAVHPLTLGILKPPGEFNTDIAVAEGQSLGLTQSFGGPLLGLFAAKKDFHQKATSNICTNEGLCALRAAVYLSLLGKAGIKEVSELIYQKSHYLAQEINKIDGYSLAFPEAPFFLEFVVKTERPSKEVLLLTKENGIFGGFDLERMRKEWKNHILIAVTEKRTKEEMDRFINTLRNL